MYLLLGCGDVGFILANKLREQGAEVTIVDKSQAKVEQLRGLGYDAVMGDFTKPETLKRAGIASAEVVLILVKDIETTELTFGAINQLKLELKIDPVIVARVTDVAEAQDLKKLGATDVIPVSNVIADYTFQKFRELRQLIKEKQLREILRGVKGKMAIVLQTNPDPDSIASGMALKHYAKTFGVESDIIYDGQIGHQQNRAMVNLLNVELIHADGVDLNEYKAHALVDVSTYGNCALPETIVPTIVIDHHSVADEVEAKYKDIIDVGATATILTNYLRYAKVELDESLATALAFAILTDTADFTRGATHLDFSALEHLQPMIDTELLYKLQSPPISADTCDVLMRAIRSSKIRSGYLISNVGEIKDRDALPQAADFLLRREGVLTTLVYGYDDNSVYLSARTNDVRLHIGKLLKDMFGKIGSAGGHPTAAGGTIPLKAFGKLRGKRALRGAIDKAIGRKFWEKVGVG
ncbi:MAG: NAD-binding protein [Hadesarchaea archaeon]|nr:NAD-binding protein [Hadesarchaea archaeon]